MLGFDARAARAVWTVAAIAAALALLYAVKRLVLVLLMAILFAYLVSPLVDVVDRVAVRGRSRVLALAVVYLLLLGAAGGAVAWLGVRVADEATALAATLPKYVQNPKLLEGLPLPDWVLEQSGAIVERVRQLAVEQSAELVPLVSRAGKGIVAAVGNVIIVILVPILSFLILSDSGGIKRALVEQFATGRGRDFVDDVLNDIDRLLAKFMRALVLLALITFLAFAAALSLLSVPYSLLLSLAAGAGEFVPIAGPLVTGTAIVAVCLITGYPHMWWVVAFLILYRLVLDYYLLPRTMGQGVALPPLAVILAVLAGEELGGILGVFLAIPAVATLRIIWVRYRKSHAASVA